MIVVHVEPSMLAGFLGVAMVAYVIPGPDWLMVMRGATDGVRHGIVTGLGTQAGLLVHGLLATVGVSALIAAAPAAIVVIQVVGALYLLYLGINGLRKAPAEREAQHVGWRQALTVNLTNPKVIVFFVAVAPQFLVRTEPVWPQMLLLVVIDVLLGVAWWTVLAVVLGPVVARVGTARINVVASGLLALIAIALLVYTVSGL